MSKTCSSCRAESIDEAKFCRKCGKQEFSDINANKLLEHEPNDKFENMTELDMFFSNEFTEKEKEEFQQKKELEQMEKRIKEIDKALKGRS